MNLRRIVFITLFASFIASSCFIAIPVGAGGIPIVLQNMFVILSGLLLGAIDGFFATLVFFLVGLMGLPIFSGARSGISHILGPTGGFLFGYMIAAFVSGLIAKKPSKNNCTTHKKMVSVEFFRITVASILGFAVLYIPGVIHFMILTKRTLFVTLTSCVFPFIPGDIIKCVITILLAKKLRPTVAQFLNPNE